MSRWPERIVCLNAESAEILYRLGARDRVAGITAYAKHLEGSAGKPVVSSFITMDMRRIEAVKPDLVFAFSDLQKDMVRDLTAAGYNVFVTNPRSLTEISETILAIGRLVGIAPEAERLAVEFENGLEQIRSESPSFPRKLRAYFEEWNDPLISGIRWAGEILELAGCEDIFSELAGGKTAAERHVSAEEVIRRNPELIILSWCGKKADIPSVKKRPGWENIEAVRNGQIFEVESRKILQPGLSLLLGAGEILAAARSAHAGGPCAV